MGYVISLLLCGHYVHKIRWKTLLFFNFSIWWLGVLGSGNAKEYNSFYVLLFSRMATGCSEAACHVVATPLIQDRGGKHTGVWLSIYLTGMPIGHNVGYIYGSYLASSDQWGWDWAYYFVCLVSLPPLIVLLFVKDDTNGGLLGGVENSIVVINDGDRFQTAREPLLNALHCEDSNATVQHSNQQKITLSSAIKACLSSPVLVTVSLGWAAIIGTCASFYTFSVSSVIALELFDNERQAASWFGTLAMVAGVVGTQIGGKLADKVLATGSKCGDAFLHPIIANMLSRINILVAMSITFILSTVLVHNAAIFLVLLFTGWVLLCKCFVFILDCLSPIFNPDLFHDIAYLVMTQTGVNLIAILAVDHCYRPNASAFFYLTSHLLGDVPIPVLMGLIKGRLAPACQVGPGGEFVDPERCMEQEKEVRKCLAIIFAWSLWCLIFFEIARQFARRQAETLGKQQAMKSSRCYYWRAQKEVC